MTCLTTSLAGPVRGIFLTRSGNALRKRYGTAMPAPIDANTVSTVSGVCVVAHAAAAPMSGAVQGVERIAVMMPKMNDPPRVSWLVCTA